MPELERSDPPYVQIARRIREDIESGALVKGSLIPSAREIMTTWGVALATATKVHARLRSEGLIEPVPGVGSIVAARNTAMDAPKLLASTRSRGLIYGPDEHAVISSAEAVSAPANVANALGLSEGAAVVRRERVIYSGSEPRSVSVSWLPAEHVDKAPALLSTDRIRQGTFAYLAAATGHQVLSGREEVCAGAATSGEAAALQVAIGDPVMRTRVWYFREDGSPIEYGEAVHPAERWFANDFTVR